MILKLNRYVAQIADFYENKENKDYTAHCIIFTSTLCISNANQSIVTNATRCDIAYTYRMHKPEALQCVCLSVSVCVCCFLMVMTL